MQGKLENESSELRCVGTLRCGGAAVFTEALSGSHPYKVSVPGKAVWLAWAEGSGDQVSRRPQQLNRRPQQLNRRPQQLNRRPQQLNRRPQQLNRRPQQLNRRPQQLNRRPQQLNRRPQQLNWFRGIIETTADRQ
ncbi:uncharacterized protein ACWYII_029907 [Salvelinus alpinus]